MSERVQQPLSRKRLALLLFIPAAVVALLVGFTRATNEGTERNGSSGERDGDEEAAPTTAEVVGVGGDLGEGDPVLDAGDRTVDVAAVDDCRGLVPDDPTPICGAVPMGATEIAWTVDQGGDRPPVASLWRRESDTEWREVLQADGAGERGFDLVNVRVDDVTDDGYSEVIFGFHNGNDLAVDVVDARRGEVVLHLDLDDGHVLVGGGLLITWTRDGELWRRQEIGVKDNTLQVLVSETVEGPAEGNL